MIRVNIKHLELWYLDSGGVPTYRYKGQPFTGIIETYENNSLLSETEYLNGFQEGWERFYHPNGQLDTEYKNHNNDTINGTYKEYDTDGNLIFDS